MQGEQTSEFHSSPHLDLLPTPPQTNRKLEGRSNTWRPGAQWSSVASISSSPDVSKLLFRDSPGGAVVKTPLPLQRAQVRSWFGD